jgi:hypothetical protein
LIARNCIIVGQLTTVFGQVWIIICHLTIASYDMSDDIEILQLRKDVERLTEQVNRLKRIVKKLKESNGLTGLTTEDTYFLREAPDYP